VVEEHSSDHVEALNIPHFHVIDAVAYQYVPEHFSEVGIVTEGRALGIGPREVFLDLEEVLLFGLLCQDTFEGG
jgi:hypothetical protein